MAVANAPDAIADSTVFLLVAPLIQQLLAMTAAAGVLVVQEAVVDDAAAASVSTIAAATVMAAVVLAFTLSLTITKMESCLGKLQPVAPTPAKL